MFDVDLLVIAVFFYFKIGYAFTMITTKMRLHLRSKCRFCISWMFLFSSGHQFTFRLFKKNQRKKRRNKQNEKKKTHTGNSLSRNDNASRMCDSLSFVAWTIDEFFVLHNMSKCGNCFFFSSFYYIILSDLISRSLSLFFLSLFCILYSAFKLKMSMGWSLREWRANICNNFNVVRR